MEIDNPETIAEVKDAFARYEAALGINDLTVLRELFWDNMRTLRYGPKEILHGADQIHAFRAGRPDVSRPRRLFNTMITTFGDRFAVANTECQYENDSRHCRQSQTWVKMPEGWRIVAAHVSFLETA
ncbi:Protein of unknown function [Roseovarius pacificus]|uniref:Oxalurate catabolism protein HpxZ n=1 Tax=Roseovarius pacificus TaxID=337701 RepID=A0A1M7KJX9_9RHOB|nr:oxalurate catabolism protein HpxZ [Roseovarius pacificus]GGO62967.1 hypothetical protein GCM10011315_43190 [Roseovarius pacificus]SHM65704.1 Protein of unknown function [Roseovarius pacificus]